MGRLDYRKIAPKAFDILGQRHAGSLRKRGKSETRLQLFVGWREAPCFSEREPAGARSGGSRDDGRREPGAGCGRSRRLGRNAAIRSWSDLTLAVVTTGSRSHSGAPVPSEAGKGILGPNSQVRAHK